MKRLFFGIKIPINKELEKVLDEFQKKLQYEKIKWVERHNLHITLKFLGKTDENAIMPIIETIDKVANISRKVAFQVKGTGVFKSVYNPRVLWFGIRDINDSLIELQKKIDNELEWIGYEKEDRDFIPHLTFARVKALKEREELVKILEKYEKEFFQGVNIDSFSLYESVPADIGVIYKDIKIFKLKG